VDAKNGSDEPLLTLLTKDGSDGGVAVVEDFVDGAADEESSRDFSQWAEGEFVLDVIVHLGSAGCVGEAVAMVPAAIRAGELDVSEGGDGVEGFDACAPVERDAEETELIVDEGSGVHEDGARGEDVEVKECGGDSLEVFGVGEEGEDFFSGPGNEEGSV
jgi:hypothetical protein